MSDNAFRERTGRLADRLMRQAAWPAALVAAGTILTPPIFAARGAFETMPAAIALSVAAASAVAVLGWSALLGFDALLFRLMASHDDDASASAAVDELLARMRIKPPTVTVRPLDDRVAGTARLLFRQRAALCLFAGAFLAAGFWAAR